MPNCYPLEHEDVGRALARLRLDDVIHHLTELWPALHILS